jgi:PAS domain S-box-containing protein
MTEAETKILLVEDNPGDARLIIEMLKESSQISYTVQVAENLSSASAFLNSQHYDIIILDLNLPDSNGLVTLDHILKNNNIPVIVLTGLKDEETGIQAIEQGAEDYLVKGEVTASQLMRSVRYAIERRKLKSDLSESREIFRQFMEHSPIYVFFKDDQIRSIYLSRNYETMLGRPVEELLYKTMDDLFPSDFAKKMISDDLMILNEKKEVTIYEEFNGRYYETIKFPIDFTGKPRYLAGFTIDITERKNAEIQIRNTISFLDSIIDQSPNPIWISDREGTLIRLNKACCDLLKISPEEVIGRYNIFEDNIVEQQGMMPLVKSVFNEGRSVNFDLSYNTSDFKPLPLRYKADVFLNVTIFPVRNSDGIITNAVIQHIDITERMRAEKALQESEEKYRIIFENINDAFFLTMPDGSIQSVNPAGCRMFGRSEEEIYSIGRNGLLDASDPRFIEGLKRREETGIFDGELTGIRKNGSRFPVAVSSVVFKDGSGCLRTSTIIRDISESIKTEKELKDNYNVQRVINELLHISLKKNTLNELLRESLYSIFSLDWLTGQAKGIIFLTASDKRELYPAASVGIVTDIPDCIRNGSVSFGSCLCGQAADTGEIIFTSGPDPRHSIKDSPAGSHGHYCIPILNEKESIGVLNLYIEEGHEYKSQESEFLKAVASVLAGTVIRKRAEKNLEETLAGLEYKVASRTAELEKANKHLESFSFSISHDLRAPLRHITGFLEMLRREIGSASGEKAEHYMDVITESSKRMGRLIDDLLSFSRMGRAFISKKIINTDSLVADVIKEYEEEIKAGNISFIIHTLAPINGDPSLLHVVFTNLISNAIKFTARVPEPRITIGCETENNESVFYVRDNGAGFDMAYADRLFGVFQRLHNDRDFEGTGIGLAMIRNIIERHGGRVWAEGEPGKGACFYFTVPVEKEV